jgi:hypothetical protein
MDGKTIIAEYPSEILRYIDNLRRHWECPEGLDDQVSDFFYWIRRPGPSLIQTPGVLSTESIIPSQKFRRISKNDLGLWEPDSN